MLDDDSASDGKTDRPADSSQPTMRGHCRSVSGCLLTVGSHSERARRGLGQPGEQEKGARGFDSCSASCGVMGWASGTGLGLVCRRLSYGMQRAAPESSRVRQKRRETGNLALPQEIQKRLARNGLIEARGPAAFRLQYTCNFRNQPSIPGLKLSRMDSLQLHCVLSECKSLCL